MLVQNSIGIFKMFYYSQGPQNTMVWAAICKANLKNNRQNMNRIERNLKQLKAE